MHFFRKEGDAGSNPVAGSTFIFMTVDITKSDTTVFIVVTDDNGRKLRAEVSREKADALKRLHGVDAVEEAVQILKDQKNFLPIV